MPLGFQSQGSRPLPRMDFRSLKAGKTLKRLGPVTSASSKKLLANTKEKNTAMQLEHSASNTTVDARPRRWDTVLALPARRSSPSRWAA